MSERGAGRGPSVVLSLADSRDSAPVRSPWIGPLLALGACLSRRSEAFIGRQLIVAISVPSREFAAVLVGSGWSISRPPRHVEADLLTALRTAVPGGNYRAVNATHVISGQFNGFDESHVPPMIALAGHWAADRIAAIAAVPEVDPADRMPRPEVGSIGRMSGISRDWDQRLVAPAADLALVGTKNWILQDLGAVLARGEDKDGDAIETLLMPMTSRSATWFTKVYSSSGLADELPFEDGLGLVVLDGQGAIKYLNDILAPIVVCVFDRSVADETAAEQLVQLRNTHGEPVSLRTQLGWSGPVGVEALAFTVAL